MQYQPTKSPARKLAWQDTEPAWIDTVPLPPRPEDKPFVIIFDTLPPADPEFPADEQESEPVNWVRVWSGVCGSCVLLSVGLSVLG